MSVAEAVRAAAQELAASSDTARLDAELLMAHALGVSRSEMLLRSGDKDGAVPDGFAALIARRKIQEPVAYILGVQEFYGRQFRVTHDVLIPRADSETTLEAALEAGSEAQPNTKRILDCGTGSGALLLSYLLENPDANGVGLDCSEAALEVAKHNADSLGLRAKQVQLRHADWTKANWTDDLGQFDLILANPPYVESEAVLSPSVRDFEPAGALFAGPEGLDDYRILIPQLRQLMRESAVAVIEIGAKQAAHIQELAASAGFTTELRRDLANRPRAMILR